MRLRIVVSTLPALLLLSPPPASACDFPYISFPQLYENATEIFIGKVVESPWRRDPAGKVVVTGRDSIRLRIERVLRGTEKGEVRIAWGSDCTFTFLEGETYLVHASRRPDGQLSADQPSRPMLLAEAGEALKYVEAAVANRKQGVVWAAINANGRMVLQDSNRRRIQRDIKPGFYEIVVAPGEYTAWVERDGKMITNRITVRVIAGKPVAPLFEWLVEK